MLESNPPSLAAKEEESSQAPAVTNASGSHVAATESYPLHSDSNLQQERLDAAPVLPVERLALFPRLLGQKVRHILRGMDAVRDACLFHIRRGLHRISEEAELEAPRPHDSADAAAAVHADPQSRRRAQHRLLHLPGPPDHRLGEAEQVPRVQRRRRPRHAHLLEVGHSPPARTLALALALAGFGLRVGEGRLQRPAELHARDLARHHSDGRHVAVSHRLDLVHVARVAERIEDLKEVVQEGHDLEWVDLRGEGGESDEIGVEQGDPLVGLRQAPQPPAGLAEAAVARLDLGLLRVIHAPVVAVAAAVAHARVVQVRGLALELLHEGGRQDALQEAALHPLGLFLLLNDLVLLLHHEHAHEEPLAAGDVVQVARQEQHNAVPKEKRGAVPEMEKDIDRSDLGIPFLHSISPNIWRLQG
mmetsp:Transcript_6562/g.16006  ORF Transcript_6562/g.16006 Transcript_6562/m.16006 type:complete len:418 (-) Transcript_6562:83-1336(-)